MNFLALEIEDAQQFRNFVRMNAVQVRYIIDLIGPTIAKKKTKCERQFLFTNV